MKDLLNIKNNRLENNKNVCAIYSLHINNHIYVGSTKNLYDRLCKHKSSCINNKHHNKFLQSCYNKHRNISYDILEILDNNTTDEILRSIEKSWIDKLNCDLNHADPTLMIGGYHEKPVYQFSKSGEYIKEWKSATIATQTLNISRDCIHQCANLKCKNSKSASNFVWVYNKKDFKIYTNNTGCYLTKTKVELFEDNISLGVFDSIGLSAKYLANILNRDWKNVRSGLFMTIKKQWKVSNKYYLIKI